MHGITIATLTGDNGLLTKTGDGKNQAKIAEEKEKIKLGYNEYKLEKYIEANPNLNVDGANVTVNSEKDWIIYFSLSGNAYSLSADGTSLEGPLENYVAESPTELFIWADYETIEGIDYNYYSNIGSPKVVKIPQKCKIIKAMVFDSNDKIEHIIFPENMKCIDGTNLFSSSPSLKNVDWPLSVENVISTNAMFASCTNIESINIPSYINSIDYSAFCDCISLKEVEIPSSITSIGEEAFCNCMSLSELNIPNSVISIGARRFLWVYRVKKYKIAGKSGNF